MHACVILAQNICRRRIHTHTLCSDNVLVFLHGSVCAVCRAHTHMQVASLAHSNKPRRARRTYNHTHIQQLAQPDGWYVCVCGSSRRYEIVYFKNGCRDTEFLLEISIVMRAWYTYRIQSRQHHI